MPQDLVLRQVVDNLLGVKVSLDVVTEIGVRPVNAVATSVLHVVVRCATETRATVSRIHVDPDVIKQVANARVRHNILRHTATVAEFTTVLSRLFHYVIDEFFGASLEGCCCILRALLFRPRDSRSFD